VLDARLAKKTILRREKIARQDLVRANEVAAVT